VVRLSKCSLPRIFTAVRAYIENSSDLNKETKKWAREWDFFVRQGQREAQRRGDDASAMTVVRRRIAAAAKTKRKGTAHCVESLLWLHVYITLETGKQPSIGELALLVKAGNLAHEKRNRGNDPSMWLTAQDQWQLAKDTLRKELTRFEKKNPLHPLVRLLNKLRPAKHRPTT
jgi:hypothetical protein